MLGFVVNFRSPASTMTSAMAATFATYACPFSAPPFDPTKTYLSQSSTKSKGGHILLTATAPVLCDSG